MREVPHLRMKFIGISSCMDGLTISAMVEIAIALKNLQERPYSGMHQPRINCYQAQSQCGFGAGKKWTN